MEFNLADLFECVADRVADREALVGADRRLTFADLDDRATRLAHGLQHHGVKRGDHVGLYLYNCPEFVEAMFACFKMRAVPINVNYRYVADELAYVCDDADLVALVHHCELRSATEGLSVPLLIEVGGAVDGLTHGSRRVGFEAVVSAGSPERDFEARSGEDRYLLYTGGTTGLPKGVVWRQEDIFFVTLGGGNPGGPPITRPEAIGDTVLVNRAQRIGSFLPPGDPGPTEFVSLALGPLVHASGQWSALGALLGGGKVVLYCDRHMNMDRVLELVARERVTMLTLVGDTSGRPLVAALENGGHDTSSVRLLGSGGSILSAEVKERLLGEMPSVLAISEAIGSSEAPVQGVAIAQPGAPSTSLRFASREVTMVVDDDLRAVAPGSGRVGRLATRGRVPVGYHKDPVRTLATFVDIDGDRWALPGDMATVDADGTIRLLGRGSMCINTGGEKVYPEEVEAVLKAHPAVADAVVVGAPDRQWGERVVAVIQPAAAPPALSDLQRHARPHVAGYKVPRALVIVDEVRRSPAGKPDYRWARQVAAESGERPSPASADSGERPSPASADSGE